MMIMLYLYIHFLASFILLVESQSLSISGCPPGQKSVSVCAKCSPGIPCPQFCLLKCVDICDASISSFTNCSAGCQPTCNNRAKLGICPLVANLCRPGCVCNDGYYLDTSDATYTKCVTADNCPPMQPPTCPVNMIYSSCASPCFNNVCSPLPCAYLLQCNSPGCVCKAGLYLQNRKGTKNYGQCIPYSQCYSSMG